jgi:hypothetical protein
LPYSFHIERLFATQHKQVNSRTVELTYGQSRESTMLVKPLTTALLLCALAVPSWAETLSAQDIRRLAPGQYAVNVMGLVSMTVTLRPNGSIFGIAKGERDRGRWSVQGQRLCIAWNKWLNGATKCSSLRGGKGRYSGSGLSFSRI